MSSKFIVSGYAKRVYGIDPVSNTEVEFYRTDEDNFVLVGVGFRAYQDDLATMQLLYARLRDDGKIDRNDMLLIRRGVRPNDNVEASIQLVDPSEVIVGCGLRVARDDVLTLRVHR